MIAMIVMMTRGNDENDDVEADRVLVMLRRQEMHPR